MTYLKTLKILGLVRAVAIFTLIIYIVSCSTKPKNNGIYYIIKDHEMVRKTPGRITMILPFYVDFNFILLDSSIYYFHYKPPFVFCVTGFDRSKPSVANLVPDSLIKIELRNLRPFLSNLLKDSIRPPRPMERRTRSLAAISSPTDTIRNIAFKTINEFLDSNNIWVANVRLLTEEEKYVLTAKIENKKYNPDSIKWKIGFDRGNVPKLSHYRKR